MNENRLAAAGWGMLLTRVHTQALLAKRRGIRLIVLAATTLANQTVIAQLTSIASSPLNLYLFRNLNDYNSVARQLTRDICATLRQSH